ncbi:MAG: AAA family ATPase [Chloroflexota bacterium]|nr:AAA family ATPase [Chloroflexota bacterium]
MASCPSCGTDNPDGLKFCGECGTRLAPVPAAREVRKTVTVLFCDVAGSTALGERLDPESLRALMTRYFGEIRRVIESHGGTVEKFIGDAVMAVFGIPTVHEDDALRAVRAASEIRETLQRLNAELEASRRIAVTFRTGITTGEVVAGDPSGQTLVTGDTVNTAARLEQAGQPGEILIGAPTYRLVRDAVTAEPVEPIAAKGKTEPLVAYRLLSVAAGVAGRSRRLDAPLVGRDRELDRLRGVWTAVVAERSCQLFTLLGTAGVGKSRLVAEFLASVAEEARVLKGPCLPYGEGITYWPLREIVHGAAGIDERDSADGAVGKLTSVLTGERDGELLAATIASAIGLSTDVAPQGGIFWATRRLLEHLARERPLVVLVEDIHWAEPALLDVLEYIADLARDAPIMLLCPARPELLDRRSGWGGGKLNATTVLLEPLGSEATEDLIDALPGGTALPVSLRRRILEAAEGNALYVEEMLGMLVDEGFLVERAGAWYAEGKRERAGVPATVQALVAARLEQLSPLERGIAERASIVGRTFEQAAVVALMPEPLVGAVPSGLVALVRKDLIRPDRPELGGGDAFRFRHLLIRDAAYGALAKADRAELHARFADWLEGVSGERVVEYHDIIGHHLEQAYRYRRDLGGAGDDDRDLITRATEHLIAAGRRALERNDQASVGILFRVRALSPRHRGLRTMLPLVARRMVDAGEPIDGLRLLDEAVDEARQDADPGFEAWARLERLWLRCARDRAGCIAAAEAEIPNAVGLLETLGDHYGLARVWSIAADVQAWRGHGAGSLYASDRALYHARASGDRREARRALANSIVPLFGGSVTIEVTVARCRAVLEADEAHFFRAVPLLVLGMGLTALGRFDEARAAMREATELLDDDGWRYGRLMALWWTAWMERRAGDEPAAEATMARLLGMAEQFEISTFVSGALVELGRFAAISGDPDRARPLIERARALISPDDVEGQAMWLTAMARLLGHEGRLDDLEAIVRDVEALSAGGDHLRAEAQQLIELAEALSAAGANDAAAVRLSRAIALFDQKGDATGAASARALLRGVQPESRLA